MDKKIPSRFADEDESGPVTPMWHLAEREELARRLKAEDDLRIRECALDMAVRALPALASSVDMEEQKFRIIRRAAAEFEKILRGDAVV